MVDAPARLPAHDLEQLRRTFGGAVITPDDAAYDEARRFWNALVRPATGGHRPAPRRRGGRHRVRFGREHGLELAVRSGGHSAPGSLGPDGGLVVDLSAMRGVSVDPATRTARTNGGALLGELDVAAQAHGLVCPSGHRPHRRRRVDARRRVGRLQRRSASRSTTSRAVELVTADGRFVRASETDEPELFWGLRGAGWNFGIATAFEFRLQPFGPDLHRGFLVFPAREVQAAWAVFREYAASAPDAVSIDLRDRPRRGRCGLPRRPRRRARSCSCRTTTAAAAEAVERDTAGLLRGPKPVSATVGSEPYLEVQTAHDLVLGWGRRIAHLSLYADDVDANALDELVELVATAPGEGTFSITAMGGAIGRLADDATAYTGRTAAFDLSVDDAWSDPALNEANRDWVRRAIGVVEPHATIGRYGNGNAEAGPAQTRAIFGDAKLARLAALKRAWDPDNVFHLNHNVAPATDGDSARRP